MTATATPPLTESTPSPHQEWSCKATMPPLSEVVSGWHDGLKDHDTLGGEGCVGGAGKGNGDSDIPPHRRKIVRTRAAPAGPHPYLDRFASGMHRPLEGDDASWRKASIEPVPIPDLGHTGIRTRFSAGAGNGFTPDGSMTENFRAGIHDTIRNLPPQAFGDARDMKTRDYARAVRKHRVDPCGGSLLHAHMSSLELAGATTLVGGQGAGLLRQSSSPGMFRSRFSPPSSPLSTRRALAGYGRGRSGNGGGRDFSAIPAESRQVVLHRELSSVKLAAAAAAGGSGTSDDSAGGGNGCSSVGATRPSTVAQTGAIGDSTMGERTNTRSEGGSRGRTALGRAEDGTADDRPQGMPTSDTEAEWRRGGGTNDGTPQSSGHVRESRGGGGGGGRIDDTAARNVGGTGVSFGGADDSAWRANRRARGKRRVRPAEASLERRVRPEEEALMDDGRDGGRLEPPLSSSPWRTTPEAAGAPPAARKISRPSARRRQQLPSSSVVLTRSKPKPRSVRHLKKPFSSDSLLSCLLDVRFGNTRDLSPEKPPGHKWDLRTLPAGITAGAGAGGGWDGFDEPDEIFCVGGSGERGGLSLRDAPRHAGHGVVCNEDRDFAVVRGGGSGDSQGERGHGTDRQDP
ncbi:unnamed protein product [Ectocarpus fasciculatus]